ncbi:MAG: zinc ABC transporter substrate-binding protein, partial [Desulfobulbaceae bacterium]|nr:zinc ABC transporter substrate-binding protein [Desulfobulbaceae bacterium]
FTERIGGENVEVVFPAPPDIDPAFWTPDGAVVRKYQKADLIILNGAGYEKWTKKVSLPMLRQVDTSKSFRDNLIHIDTTVTHSHGPGGDHSHGGTAFTTWLDFSQAALQAKTIYDALIRRMPSQKDTFSENHKLLQKDLLALDETMLILSGKKPGKPLFASHPIYQYMARRYSLNLRMVMWEPDKEPVGKEWKYLQELAQSHHADWMIWEAKPLSASAEKLYKMNIMSQVFSPCYAVPHQGDFLSIM